MKYKFSLIYFLICIFEVMKVLVISTVWVEPTSSAAGSRMLQLLKIFLEKGWEIVYTSTAKASEYAFDVSQLGIRTAEVEVNNESFNAFAKAYQPNLVLFDRFISEEQFGWRIAQECPDALRILDTEDLHCLRKARQQAVKENRPFAEADLVSDVAKREIASIYRSDLTLMISPYEMALLQNYFTIPERLLCYLPFLEERLEGSFKSFEERAHFVSIGNFIHAPNWDATLELKKNIWPLIRKELPEAQLHVYGAYPSEKVLQLHNKKEGFLVKGRAAIAHEVISHARVLLAPLRFGAGLKGKFIDAMQCGTPSVTTSVGVEGMQSGLDWCGMVADGTDAFAKAAISLYADKTMWAEAQENGVQILNTNFQKITFEADLIARLQTTLEHLEKHREANFIGLLLQHHTLQSTKYMSKWIEEKNK